ncbi:MAG: hypothetical protein IKZ41_07775, partial [Clostridia bacterium]|nr:hypothetical protein [Clostridia bacterium]
SEDGVCVNALFSGEVCFRTAEGRRIALRVESEYPREIEADRETAECFRRKYVNGHKVLREGWNVSL